MAVLRPPGGVRRGCRRRRRGVAAGRQQRTGDRDDQAAERLSQLSDLAARVRDTGVPVTLTIDGTFGPLPAGVELAAYRVVQEALTNAVKHAAGAAVTISVSGTPESCGSR